MESSEINTQVINLGKKLISELRLDFDNDITARWMAHYVAEKIVAAEKPDSTEVERDCCFDAILKLWNHRYSCPEEVRPFQRFESVYAGLARLDISSDSHYFQRFEKLSPETIKKLDDRSKQWVDLALAVDNGARFMISELFSLATASASSDEIKEILKTTPDPHAPVDWHPNRSTHLRRNGSTLNRHFRPQTGGLFLAFFLVQSDHCSHVICDSFRPLKPIDRHCV